MKKECFAQSEIFELPYGENKGNIFKLFESMYNLVLWITL